MSVLICLIPKRREKAMANKSTPHTKCFFFRKRHAIAAMAVALPLLATPGIAFALDETPSSEVVPTAIEETTTNPTNSNASNLLISIPVSEENNTQSSLPTNNETATEAEVLQDETTAAHEVPKNELISSTDEVTKSTPTELSSVDTETNFMHKAVDTDTPAEVTDGLYEIATFTDPNKVVDVRGGSRNNGAAVQTYRSNGTGAQVWRVTQLGGGLYTLQNLRSGKYLDIPAAKAVEGAQVQQYTENSTKAQQWEIVPDEGRKGYFVLRAYLNGNLVLDTKEGILKLGFADGDATQAFSFERIVAAVSDGLYEINNVNAQKPIEIPGGSNKNGAPVAIYASNNSASQRWRIQLAGKDSYTIQNVRSGKFLSTNTSKGKLSRIISQRDASYASDQIWKLSPVDGSGIFTVVSALDSNMVLDVTAAKTTNGTKLQLYKSNGTLAQYFSFSQINQNIADGVYELKNLKSHLALEVNSGSITRGENIQQGNKKTDGSQYFYVRYNHGNGYYTFTNVKSGKRLEVKDASNSQGANIQQGDVANSYAQQWTIREDNGLYGIYSAIGGLALDVSGGSTASGANVRVWTSNASGAQRWTFKHVDQWLNNGTYKIIATNNNGNVLAVVDGSHNNSTAITTRKVQKANNYQKWQLSWDGNFIKLINVATGKALDIRSGKTTNGTIIQQFRSNNSNAQRWLPVMTESGIMLQSALDAHVVVDIAGGSKSAGAKIQTYTNNNSLAQRFLFVNSALLENGTIYTIYVDPENTLAKSNQVMDVQGASKVSGTRVQIYTTNKTAAQQFELISVGEDSYRLQNVNSKLFITANASGTITQTAANNSSTVWLPRWDDTTDSIVLMSSSQLKAITAVNGRLNLTNWSENNSTQGFLFTNIPQQKRLHGIDIFSGDGDAGINIARIPADFIIVKATQGTDYTNRYFRKHADETLAAGKLLGLYHFVDTTKGAINEARYFVDTIKGKAGETNYIGKAVLFLDWENNDVTGQNNISKGPKYAKAFLDEVKRLTGGVKPLIYMSKSVTGSSYNWQSVADAGYGLWMAQYLYKYYDNDVKGHVDNPTLIYNDAEDGQREWSKPTLYQYTSKGKLPNYSKYLDMNVFYGNAADWNGLAARH